MEETLSAWIEFSLSHHLTENAIFLAERLVAHSRNEDTLHLLASAHLDDTNAERTFHILKNSTSEQNRYLAAVAALRTKRFQEGLDLLLPRGEPANLEDVPHGSAGLYILGQLCRKLNQRERAVKYFSKSLELNPMMWCSYEALCKLGENIDPATFFGQEDESSADWNDPSTEQPLAATEKSAAEPLVAAAVNMPKKQASRRLMLETPGSKPPAPLTALLATPALAQRFISSALAYSPRDRAFSPSTPATNLFSARFSAMPSPAHLIARGRQLNFGSESETPMRKPVVVTAPLPVPQQTPLSSSASAEPTTSAAAAEMPAPSKRATRTTRTNSVPSFAGTSPRRSTRLKPDAPEPASAAATAASAAKKTAKKPPLYVPSVNPPAAPKAKKSVGLTSTAKQAAAPSGKVPLRRSAEDALFIPTSSDTLFTVESTASTSQEPSIPVPTVTVEGVTTQVSAPSSEAALAGTVAALTLLRKIGDAFRKLCRYDCFEAIEAFKQLPPDQYNTGWVLVHVGRAYFEMIEYTKAQSVFEQVRLLEPHRLQGMETFSTTLWHLRRETDLSFLAQELTDIDKNAPETLCTIGNCFSLQKEHEMALKYFQRAVTVDPDYVYAYTLSGHEHIAVDQWDAALDCFRRALRLDPRHYNAWFGLGIIYLRQEKYEYAEYHFRKAIAINGRSSVLFCYVGMVLSSLRRYKDALDALNQACNLDPKNVLAKFKRASAFVHLTLYKDALVQLESIMETSPREVAVLYMVGRIYKRLKDIDKAQFYLTQALDMDRDTKTTNFIKSTLESLHMPDNLDDNNFELL